MRTILTIAVLMFLVSGAAAASTGYADEDKYFSCLVGTGSTEVLFNHVAPEKALKMAEKACSKLSDAIQAKQDEVEGDVGDAIEFREDLAGQVFHDLDAHRSDLGM